MIKLNRMQRDYLTSRRDNEVRDLDDLMARLVQERAKGLGNACSRMAWDGYGLMLSDSLAHAYDDLLRIADDPEAKATLDSLTEWYTREVLTWRPGRSSGALHNIANDVKIETAQKVLEVLGNLKLYAKEA